MLKNLVLILKANQCFICSNNEKNIEKNKVELNQFFESISDLYIPLLNSFEKLTSQNINCKMGLVLPPVLCSMLDDKKNQDLYIDFLDKRIELGKNELIRCKNKENEIAIINKTIAENEALKKDFIEKYECNIVKQFAEYQKKGIVEILATCATDIYLPHYADLPEVISAQIEIGLQAYKKSFGDVPEGFFLPDFGYFPGVEKIIRAYGYSYTILHGRSILLSDTLPENGIFYPVRTDNSLCLFTNDPFTNDLVLGDEGYCQNSVYRNENRDIGFELDIKELNPVLEENSARCSTGYKYWKKDFKEDQEASYDFEAAKKQARNDAFDFLAKKQDLLQVAEKLVKNIDYVASVCCFDDSAVRKNWRECLLWLEEVFVNADKYGLTMSVCKEMVAKQFTLEKINPYFSAGIGDGYGENLLSSKNCWMMRYIRKASERMIDLSDRFPTDTGLKTRLLNIGATELLIAQSGCLAKMIDEDNSSEFAENRFKQSINDFTAVFDSLGSNTVSTEWLTTLEIQDNLFPWINYKVFSKKK